jgi:hypothetical protein
MEKIIKETSDFRLKVRKTKCFLPKDTFHIQYIQENLISNTDSTYDFFLNSNDLKKLSKFLNQNE